MTAPLLDYVLLAQQDPEWNPKVREYCNLQIARNGGEWDHITTNWRAYRTGRSSSRRASTTVQERSQRKRGMP